MKLGLNCQDNLGVSWKNEPPAPRESPCEAFHKTTDIHRLTKNFSKHTKWRMLSFDQYKSHQSDQILHNGPLTRSPGKIWNRWCPFSSSHWSTLRRHHRQPIIGLHGCCSQCALLFFSHQHPSHIPPVLSRLSLAATSRFPLPIERCHQMCLTRIIGPSRLTVYLIKAAKQMKHQNNLF